MGLIYAQQLVTLQRKKTIGYFPLNYKKCFSYLDYLSFPAKIYKKKT